MIKSRASIYRFKAALISINYLLFFRAFFLIFLVNMFTVVKKALKKYVRM